MKRKGKIRHVWLVPAILCILLAAGRLAIGCMPPSYPASDAALEAQATGETNDHVTVFRPEHVLAGMIFYPGGRVEHEAYAPLMRACADRGILCLLLEMPLDLAVLDMHAAQEVRNAYADETDVWLIGGHSLGGAMAASHAAGHEQDYTGLVLLGAYAADDLRDTGLRVLSVFGSEDGVLNREKYEACLANYPKDFMEMEIEGGNHAGFGDYGEQAGDGKASIAREAQIARTADAIAEMIR